MSCTQDNPCSCVSTCNPSDPPVVTNNCDCLNLPYITVFPDDSVGPCGQTGTVDFSDCFDFCACEEEVAVLTVMDIDPPVLVVNSINTGGMSYTTTEDAEPYDKVEVTIKATCTDKDDEDVLIGDYTTITIWIKDLCKNVLCESGEICNKCTGECDPNVNLTTS